MDGWIVVSILLIGLVVIAARHMGLAATLAGRRGEFLIGQALRSHLPSHEYRILGDVRLEYRDAEVQIDFVVVSRHGVLLIESLHNAGDIVAEPGATHWTGSWLGSRIGRLLGRRRAISRRFVNPLRKHVVHLQVLCERLDLSPALFETVMVCTGSTRFIGQRPLGVVRLGGLLPLIQIRNAVALDHDEVYALADSIEALAEPAPEPIAPLPPSWFEPLQKLNQRLDSVRAFLHVGIDPRRPITGMVRTATGFLLAMLMLTLVLDSVGERGGQEEQPMMASMEAGAPSPFADAGPNGGPNSDLGNRTTPRVAAPTLDDTLAGSAAAPVGDEQRRRELVQQALDRQLAWEASLVCRMNEATGDCGCRDPLGDAAELSAEHCQFLVASSTAGGEPSGGQP